jgi:Domain of unknown function (DUF4234)
MVNQRIVKWVIEAKKRKLSKDEMTNQLIQSGFNSNQVKEAINYVNNNKKPQIIKAPKQTGPKLKQPIQKQAEPKPKPILKKQIPPQKPVQTNQTNGGIKKRNPALVLIFSIITFGIYFLYWLVSTTNELRRNAKSAPNPWLLLLFFIPFVNFIAILIYYWKYSKAINELTGFSAGGMFALWILLNPVAMVLTQIELNKKAQ